MPSYATQIILQLQIREGKAREHSQRVSPAFATLAGRNAEWS